MTQNASMSDAEAIMAAARPRLETSVTELDTNPAITFVGAASTRTPGRS